MDFVQLLAKVKDTPVLCIDGNVGMLVSYPIGDAPTDPAGIQVPGELELRWLPQEGLQPSGSALKQAGSPRRPLRCETAGEHARLACNLLGELWMALQPQSRHSGLVLSWPD